MTTKRRLRRLVVVAGVAATATPSCCCQVVVSGEDTANESVGAVPTEAAPCKGAPRLNGAGAVGDVAENRIVAGLKAQPGEFPYFVKFGACGGTLIHEDVVLTAGRCRAGSPKEAYVGAYKGKSLKYGAERITVSRKVQHPAYSFFQVPDYDYMLVLLSRPSTNPTAPLLNADRLNPLGKQDLTAIGMGVLQEGGYRIPVFLRKVAVRHVPYGQCRPFYGRLVKSKTMVCASGGIKGVCHGDSGTFRNSIWPCFGSV